MKRLLAMGFLVLILMSCEEQCDSVPGAPYGNPDDVTEYSSGDYKSVDYTYYCHNGKYESITYSRSGCDKWEKSVFTSSGICD